MEKLTFYIVDVFAEEKYAGNQLAVVMGAKALSDTEMQRIAKEMNETLGNQELYFLKLAL